MIRKCEWQNTQQKWRSKLAKLSNLLRVTALGVAEPGCEVGPPARPTHFLLIRLCRRIEDQLPREAGAHHGAGPASLFMAGF